MRVFDTRCEQCKNYAPLRNPYFYDKEGYPSGVTVYGFCAKDAKRNFGFYPVYLPDGGVCKEYKKASNFVVKKPIDGQLKMTFEEYGGAADEPQA